MFSVLPKPACTTFAQSNIFSLNILLSLNYFALALTGLKIVGGQGTEHGQFGAFITKVKKGSIADTVGHLRPGQLVVQLCFRDLLNPFNTK